MTLLVFGKTGQVARELQARAPIVALGRDGADLSDPESCVAAIEAYSPTAVINAAAYTAVDKTEEQEQLATMINGAAPTAMARACAAVDIPFVHISTDYVFEGSGEEAWQPSSPLEPINAYGRSKLLGERGVQIAGGRCVILRTSWVFSSHGQNFLKTMLRVAEKCSDLRVVADQIGGPTPAGEIAQACLAIAVQLGVDPSKSGIYHFSGAPDVSWADFARAIFAAAGKDVRVHDILTSEYPAVAKRPLNSRLDCRSTLETFDLVRPDWREAIPQIIYELEQAA